MYKQPTALPTITFKIVRYEVFQTQPVEFKIIKIQFTPFLFKLNFDFF